MNIIIAAALGGLLGFLGAVFFAKVYKTYQQGKKKEKNAKEPKKREFKKLLVVLVLASYFLGVAFGIYIVFRYDYSQLAPLLTFIGAPTTGAILSYCYVIRTENAIKLKQRYPEETEGYTVDINNTSI